ncbi:hypothetical protein LQW54_009055 [Pestalotiopsis sp. IQ-011]
MSMAALANWLFIFALGLFTPPGFVNIKYNLFIVFGILSMIAAACFFVFYPETCGKTLEEIELLSSKHGPKPWKTRKGESRLVAEIQGVLGKHDSHEEPVAGAFETKV